MGNVIQFDRSGTTTAKSYDNIDVQSYIPESQETKATAEGLYGTDAVDRVSRLGKIVDLLNKALANVTSAIADYEDEMERDGQIDLLKHNVFELILLKGINQNFGDVLTAVQVALKNKGHTPFTKVELVKMNKVLEITKNNFNMTESILDQCLSILDDHFDLNIPTLDEAKDA